MNRKHILCAYTTVRRLTRGVNIFYVFVINPVERSLRCLALLARKDAWKALSGAPAIHTLTVSEIAEKLRPVAPDVKATLIRLSHWTLQGMLIPVDQMHAGTGKRRIYAADDVYSAAILHVLTAFGLTVSAVRPLVDGLSQARSAVPGWKKQRAELYLKVWWRSPGRATFDVDAKQPEFKDKDLRNTYTEPDPQPAELLLAIDLRELWSRIEGKS